MSLEKLSYDTDGVVLMCSEHPETSQIQKEIQQEIEDDLKSEILVKINGTTLSAEYKLSIYEPIKNTCLILTSEMENAELSIQLPDNSQITLKKLMIIVNSWRKLEKDRKWKEIRNKHGI